MAKDLAARVDIANIAHDARPEGNAAPVIKIILERCAGVG